jgi:2-polyprenyl-3-methyl-5-hydroxy-6-metoxy-1,4-benzoquinol methylase
VKRVAPTEGWPESWRRSYEHDRLEIYDELDHKGYAYAYANRREHTLRLLEGAALPPGARILDVAAAQGNFTLALAERGYEVTWNDLREDLIDYVQAKHERGSIRFAPGNIFELDFPERFDAVLATEVIEHVAHPDRFLRRLSQLTEPGGCIIVTTPNGGYFRSTLPTFQQIKDPDALESLQFRPDGDGHLFLLTARELCELATAAGLEVDELQLFTNSLTNGHLKLEHALRVMPRGLVNRLENASQRMPAAIASRALIHLGARFRVAVRS